MIRIGGTRGRYWWIWLLLALSVWTLLAVLFAGCSGYTNVLMTWVKTGMTKAEVLEANPWPLSRYSSSSGYSSLRYRISRVGADGWISISFRNGVLTGWTESLRR